MDGKNNIFVILSINQTESQQNLNMKSDTWSWTKSSSIQLNVLVELKKCKRKAQSNWDRSGRYNFFTQRFSPKTT